MKHKFLLSCLFANLLLLGFDIQQVGAQGLECISNMPVSPLYMEGGGTTPIAPDSGAIVTVAQNVHEGFVDAEEVKNVVVFGQDPAEEGISITVNITSVPGKIQHDEWFKRKVTRCVAHSANSIRPAGAVSCPPYTSYNPPLVYYYEDIEEDVCQRFESPATRKIKAVRIWLEPSQATSQWLGWEDMKSPDGRASLRYMFPDKWMTGTWTEDGFVTSGTPDRSWSETYYENWLAQQQGVNFLAGESNADFSLWSVTLPEVGSPENGKTSLGLLGNFDPGDIGTLTAPVSAYTVSYDEINSNTKHHRAAYYPQSMDPVFMDYEEVTINLVHIPLDLPGIWNIGVWVKMEVATSFDGITEVARQDIWGAETEQWFKNNESGYNMTDNYFFAYVLISTPCNPLENKGCWDGNW
jgi:hypothetical protein